MAGLNKSVVAVLVGLCAIYGAVSCKWENKDSEEFYKMLIVGTIIGAIFGIGTVIAGSLPLCCGIGKKYAKPIAGVIIAIGIIICFIPVITGKAQTDAAVDKMCDRCEASNTHDKCKDEDRSKAKDAVGALGILVAYLHAFGFVVVILGATAASLGCCILCKCCKMKDDPAGAPAGGAVTGQVVGKY